MKVKYNEVDFECQSSSQIVFLKNNDLWFFISPKRKSRYFGGFLLYKNKALRFLDEIDFQDEIEEIQILSPQEVIFYFKNNQVYLDLKEDSLKIIFSSWHEIKLTFDIKDIFKNEPFKRKIEIEKISSCCLVLNEFLENEGFIKILIESDSPINFQNNWNLKFYDFDKQRNSPPHQWYVYDGIFGKIKELKIKILQPGERTRLRQGFGGQVLTRMVDANSYTANGRAYGTRMDASIEHTNSPIISFLLSRINNLILDSYLPAGFPWFYENWFRDELLSLFLIKDFINEEFFEQRMKFYLYNLENIWDKNKLISTLPAVDTFLLLILNLPQNLFSSYNSLLEKYLKLWQEKFDIENLPPFSTWMDTLERKNALEIFVLYLKALRRFAKVNKNYIPLANQLKEKIINLIKQNPVDVNLIFAYLFLEDIFSKSEWEKFFEKLLEENYLDWGGIATISKNDSNFLDEDDGEIAKAYHRGDSWYYLNNLLAYSLAKINYRKFKNIIEKIFLASLEDLFFDGALGYSSEISSAKQRKSEGSLVQLWSMASLVLLITSFQNINISLKSLSNSHNIISIKT